MPAHRFPLPDDAEAAFYRAFQSGDLDAMMAVWDEGDDIVCVHPLGPRLEGRQSVAESWRPILGVRPRLRVSLSHVRRTVAGDLAVYSAVERIAVREDEGVRTSVILATNVYRSTLAGWRMILHHASPIRPVRPRAPAVVH